ncbi:uncharacterized protein LAESUDRAFT_720461 [Laetiporus sulphureus 93-53]|uniref:MARVEL domain-containing protein n=1 Tax=Laetiporus sulphureus 93-53 TaxID=1314785 RepID=A0A165H532_9APHY|nr:uncharacterized protein LAESUDRAFT_720461 [Laetiporus sulphureus 93-53]KZT11254.1 hypothetical protein LAESUDRAFT_720461 [Laetiporus sulphureus 93-53]
MNKLFASYRYFVFVLFVICNAVICAVAAWNLSLALDIQFHSWIEVDALLVSAAATALLFIFTFMFVDVLCKQSAMRHVWVECLWVGLFGVLELACAAAVTTTTSDSKCVTADEDGQITEGPCTTSSLMVGFTWAAATDMLMYFAVLAVIALLHQRNDPLIWQSSTLDYSWFALRSSLPSAPSSPTRALPGNPSKSSRGSPPPYPTEFGRRMFANPPPDLEKQDLERNEAAAPMPASVALYRMQSQTARPFPAKRASWQPRQLQLSANVPLPTTTAPTPKPLRTAPVETVAPSPSPSPPPESDSGSEPSTPATPLGRPHKKRVLRLHRPPPLDLSRISSFR